MKFPLDFLNCVSKPVLLAPMAGITDKPFRALARRFGATLTTSEMIAGIALAHGNERTRERASTTDGAREAVQIAGSDLDLMAEAARQAEALGACSIDINMGCPALKVVKGCAGASLMKDVALAGRVIETVVRAVRLPVSVKMRLGWDHDSLNAPELARVAQESGASWLAVHGRTRAQFYAGHSDWSKIAEVKQSVTIPVFGNGDIQTLEDAVDMLAQSGTDGLLIGRGAQGRPWFLGQVAHFLETGERIADPSNAEKLAVALEHYNALLDYYGLESGVNIARKHLAWYTAGLANSAAFRNTMNYCTDPQEVKDLLHQVFEA